MRIAGIVIVVLALVLGIVPQFSDCQSQGQVITLPNGNSMPMKCHWTARAELGTAIPLFLVGGVMVWSKRRETLRALAVPGMALGVVAILLPTTLIGVCGSPAMVCNIMMKPTVVLAGTLVTLTSAFVLVQAKGTPSLATDQQDDV